MSESGDPDTFNSCGPHNSSPMMAFPSRKKRKEKKKSRYFDDKNSSKNILMKRKEKKKGIIERGYQNWRKIVPSNCSISIEFARQTTTMKYRITSVTIPLEQICPSRTIIK